MQWLSPTKPKPMLLNNVQFHESRWSHLKSSISLLEEEEEEEEEGIVPLFGNRKSYHIS